MDFAEARLFSDALLVGGKVAGWEPGEYLSHGKSAVVLRASKDKKNAILKVFHPGLMEQYGREAQLIRVNRERELINRHHPNMVRLLDTGVCKNTGHIFVVMEIAPGRRLSEILDLVPRANIGPLIEQLASAAMQLENWGFTHRDIKPDNIHVSDDLSSLMLLDFGVLRPPGDNSATVLQASKAFVGTHQYSPTEMIHGCEEDTLDRWRAITFYQIGAVLHDLIVRKPIFQYATARHADLVRAIDNDPIVVKSDEVDAKLCNLATRCLLKKPLERLELVRWEDFTWSDSSSPLLARKDALRRQLLVSDILSRVDVIEAAEARRLQSVNLQTIVRCTRTQFDQALADLGKIMPMRSTDLDVKLYPSPAITYTFVEAPSLGLTIPFRIQVAVALKEESSLIEVYARASKGLAETEIGWNSLGPAMQSLDGFAEIFQIWMLTIIEELVRT